MSEPQKFWIQTTGWEYAYRLPMPRWLRDFLAHDRIVEAAS